MAPQFEHKDRDVRWTAIEVLQGRTDLTEGILQGIATRVEHKDSDVRLTAIEVLQGRADLTEGMLQGIAARLEDKDKDVRRAAVDALLKQATLSLNVLSPYLKSFYKALLQKSFEEHLYWCTSDLGFIGVSLRHISLIGSQHVVDLGQTTSPWKLGQPEPLPHS
ncbi:hypothetical protein QBC40DRAFT_183417 [Triangularia verruculosa]|uniref:HEAT repeat domain-containing protein n=1 Tax=Triangularia verruculosa TaxID=2587418 RepID=A0AAN6X994_9PEZI|nr:hypothetical protein QBC40DRAFT_183417 [Triangularia verruculosa]